MIELGTRHLLAKTNSPEPRPVIKAATCRLGAPPAIGSETRRRVTARITTTTTMTTTRLQNKMVGRKLALLVLLLIQHLSHLLAARSLPDAIASKQGEQIHQVVDEHFHSANFLERPLIDWWRRRPQGGQQVSRLLADQHSYDFNAQLSAVSSGLASSHLRTSTQQEPH